MPIRQKPLYYQHYKYNIIILLIPKVAKLQKYVVTYVPLFHSQTSVFELKMIFTNKLLNYAKIEHAHLNRRNVCLLPESLISSFNLDFFKELEM
jgi:hypothetical protein